MRRSEKTFLFKERVWKLTIAHVVVVVWVGIVLLYGYRFLEVL